MITSHSLHDYDAIAVSIESISISGGNATICFSNAMEWHAACSESPSASVQVGLLSRDLLFAHAEDDVANPLHGGNLVIVQSQNIPQLLQGAEFRGFGQQGLLGKCPAYYRLTPS